MMRSISTFLTVVVLFTQLNLGALWPKAAAASPCGEPTKIYLPIIHAMAQPTILENLEQIMTADAAFPFDAVITQIFTNTVNVKPVGSRTIIRDVALPEFIKPDDLQIGYPVRLGHSGSKVTVEAYFEQFADPESFNYAGLGSKIPGKPTLSVQATKAGWVLTWPKVAYATKYLIYQNDTADGDSPELVQTVNVTNPNLATYTKTLALDPPFVYFAVQACNGLLEGDLSLWKTDVTPPAAPIWKAHAYQTGGHYLEWTHPAPVDVMEFIVYRNFQLGDQFAAEVTRTANLNTIVDYVNMSDYFGVQAVDWSGLNKSAIVWYGPYDPTPATPANFQVNLVEGGGYVCAWSATAQAVSYIVQSSDNSVGEEGDPIVTIYTGAEFQTHVVLNPNYTFFRVAAVGIDGSMSGWSIWDSDDNPPPQPVITTVGGIGSVTISLAANDTSHSAVGFSHYLLEMADGASGQNATFLDDHALYASFPRVLVQVTGTTKYYRLTPFDWAGNAGTATNWIAASPSIEGATVKDKFDTYGGLRNTDLEDLFWYRISQVEPPDTPYYGVWPGSGLAPTVTTVTSPRVHGTNAWKLVINSAGVGAGEQYAYRYHLGLVLAVDVTTTEKFTDDDYVLVSIYNSNAANTTFNYWDFYTGGGPDDIHIYQWPALQTGWNHLKFKKSEFQGDLGVWQVLRSTSIEFMSAQNLHDYVVFDDMRLAKADPDDPTDYNDTGRAWDKAASTGTDKGQWHIYEGNMGGEPSKPFSYGQIAHNASPTKWYASYKPDLNIISGTIQGGVFHKENGKSGLGFFVKSLAPDNWTMYAVEADNNTDTVTLVKWVNGTRTVLGSGTLSPFISAASGAAGQTVWIGADFSEYDTDSGRIKVYASTVEGNLIQAGNLKISMRDTSLGSGGTVALLSNQTNVRFVNLTAGSPAHAEVADVAKALDGPVIAGDIRRVHYSLTNNRFEYTDDGTTMVPVAAAADANKVDKTSANRPGVFRLYRRDNDSNYSVQPSYDGSRWLLQGYNASDVFHAMCRVGYADNAGLLSGYTSAQLKANASVVYRSTDITGASGTYTIPWNAYYWNDASMWDGSTALYAQRTGWHMWYANVNINPTTTNTDNVVILVLRNGTNRLAQHNDRRSASLQACGATISGIAYLTAGEYIQCQATTGYTFNIIATNGNYFGMVSLESA